jgi:hypothetical protein
MTDFRPTVYLAGPIRHAENGGHDWRDDIIEEYGDQFDFLNPLDAFDTTEDEISWLQPGEVPEDYPESETVLPPKELIQTDKQMIREADAMLLDAREQVPTYGTPREHEYAVQVGTPVVVRYEEGQQLSPWQIGDAEFLHESRRQCMRHIYVEHVRDQVEGIAVDALADAI